jgi:superoxide reductase
MTQKHQIWKCNICGNIVEVLHEGADSLVCCGQPMVLMTANSVDAAKEKHVPVIEGNTVKIGSEPHPMTSEHFIEWIEATSESGLEPCKKFLKPGDKPEVEFPFKVISARAYCNLHGLWK